jgi:hypothetical protein
VVVGDLEQAAVAQQVGAAVADVHQGEPRPGPEHRGERAAAVRELRVGLGGGAQRRGRRRDRVGQRVEQVARGFRGFERAKRVDDGFACRVATRTSAVGDGDLGLGRPLISAIVASGRPARRSHATRRAWSSWSGE